MAFRFTLWLRGLILLLVVQFVLGVWLNLYGKFPDTKSVARAAMYSGDPVLSAHMALAVVLVLAAFVVAIYAFTAEAPPRLRWFTLGGFLALLAAYEAGVELIVSGFTSNVDSAVMAVAFFVAMGFFGLGLRYARIAPPPAAPETPASPA